MTAEQHGVMGPLPNIQCTCFVSGATPSHTHTIMTAAQLNRNTQQLRVAAELKKVAEWGRRGITSEALFHLSGRTERIRTTSGP